MNSKHVILVDKQNNVLGIKDKLEAHQLNTPLHRGFSMFLFNKNKELIIQKRHSSKITWGGFWSNSFCGHPQLNESPKDAILRHAKFELGLNDIHNIKLICNNYSYKFTFNNITENEICPIYIGISNEMIKFNSEEVSEIQFLRWNKFKRIIMEKKKEFSPWSLEEMKILDTSKIFETFLNT